MDLRTMCRVYACMYVEYKTDNPTGKTGKGQNWK